MVQNLTNDVLLARFDKLVQTERKVTHLVLECIAEIGARQLYLKYRIRACRGVGAALQKDQVEVFDKEHASLLEQNMPDQFTVLHQLDAHFFLPPETKAARHSPATATAATRQ